jgi:GNAT superfamily N-acetyltransferase
MTPAVRNEAFVDAPVVRRVTPEEARTRTDALAAGLAEVLVDCVDGGASVSFMAPLAADRAEAFWRRVLADVAAGARALLVAEDATGRLVGTVQLVMDLPENQPHRADVAKMLVHRSARRRGLAQRLMAALDDVAFAEGRTVLVLDTVTGGDAERLYPRAGWQRVGDVPRYALKPDGQPCGTTFFYKHLAPGAPGGRDDRSA